MKIKIKHKIDSSSKHLNSLSKEKEYLVLGIGYHDYRIINDYGEPLIYPEGIFDVLDPSIPNDWVKSKYSIGPEFAAKVGFYEDLFDDNHNAVYEFHKYVIENGYMTEVDWDRQWIKGRLIGNYGVK